MKVLVTGGAGFIGSHLVDELLARGDEALVIDNFATGRRDNVPPRDGLTVVEGTIADAKLVARALDDFGEPDVVVHAAASYKDPDNWPEDVRTNILGTSVVVQAALARNVRRLIYFQTSLCYGLAPQEQPITIDHPILPRGSSYAISKTAGEDYIALSGMEFLSFRLANAYGPRNFSGPLPTFYSRLAAGKPCYVVDTRRDFMYVDDVLEVVLKAVDGVGDAGYYHISTGRDYSIKELFEAVQEALGIELDEEVEVRPRGEDNAYTILLDPSKTNGAFDWKAHTPLTDGVREAVAWCQTHDLTETFTHLKTPETEGDN